jgi:site-specific DNA recombinase
MATQAGTEAAPLGVKRSVRLLRVSTTAQTDTDYDDERSQGNSIDPQGKVTIDKERRMGTVNVGEYVEPGYSGQSIEKRPFFKELMQRITTQRDVDYVVIYMRSRVFRNYIEAALVKRQLEQLGVKIVSAKEDFGDGYMAEAMEAVTDVFNWLQVKISGQDIKTKMANKARNGGTIGKAKVGYRNVTRNIEGHKVNTVEVDAGRAPFIRMAFELFAAGNGRETVETVHEQITRAGLRMPGNAKRPPGPISHEQLRLVLRDPYYKGVITYEGIAYPGRHEPLVSEELFDRVQRILDAHSGSGIRHQKHNHYLKGTLWCARCTSRLIVQRAEGNGGEYFYFDCRGRQKGLCDLPYIPIDVLEAAVARYYGDALVLDPAWLQIVRDGVDAAVAEQRGLPEGLREQYDKRLEALDRKEGYLLDLAAEESWPKDKLRERIEAIRKEIADIRRTIEQADQHLDVGQQLLHDALALLSSPCDAYRVGNERVRLLLNRAFFTKLYVDGEKITGHELRKPFDVLLSAYEEYVIARPSSASSHEHATSAGLLTDSGAVAVDLASNSTSLTWWVSGWSSNNRVDDTGIEPVTSSVSGKRSPAELIVLGRSESIHQTTVNKPEPERTTGFEPATLTLAR